MGDLRLPVKCMIPVFRIISLFSLCIGVLALATIFVRGQETSLFFSSVAANDSTGAEPAADADPFCATDRYDLQPVIDTPSWWDKVGLADPVWTRSRRPAGITFRPASATAQTVDIAVGPGGFSFEPSGLTINIGDTVRWTWAAGGHTVTGGSPCTANNSFCSPSNTNCASAGSSSNGSVYSRVFNQAGTFPYFCRPHCGLGMTDEVTVNAVQVRPTPNDFDGDGKADLVVFRPADASWYQLRSSNNAFIAQQFGAAGDLITPGDYDGDQKTDLSVFRTGNWYQLVSANGSFRSVAFGLGGDIPVGADYDGDGKYDIAVFRPADGAWYILQSATNSFRAVGFGANGDRPLIANFDADSKSDIAVYRPTTGAWYYLQSSDSSFHGVGFGATGDKPVPGDYDGDGKTDLAVFRPSEGSWYTLQTTAGFRAVNFGLSSDIPVPADYDGDGKTDVGVYRNGNWFELLSTNGSFRAVQFGSSGDIPAPAANIL